jgi:hypothetical protein
MVNPLEIMPILALAIMIVCIPILSDGPSAMSQQRQAGPNARF